MTRFQKANSKHRFLLMILIVGLLYGCSAKRAVTPEVMEVSGDILDAVAAQSVVSAFLQAWQDEEFTVMYDMLSSLSQDAIGLDEFEATYRNMANSLTLENIAFQLQSAMAEHNLGSVAYRVDFNTRLFGMISRDMVAGLVYEQDRWTIQWEPGLMMPELVDGNRLEFVHKTPSRGRILDRAGAPLASYENRITLGLVPGEILPEQEALLYSTLAEVSVYDPVTLSEWVDRSPDDWYLPIANLSNETAAPYMETLRGLKGVRIGEDRLRSYVDGGVAPHVLGYKLFIPEEELETYLRMGYRQDEQIGAAGLEAAYEQALSGKHGGSLYLVDVNGYTTLDKTLQMRLQESLGDLRGAVVVMEVDTGRVLAMVSNPHFDPNAFDLSEDGRSLLDSYFTDDGQPLFNRAAQGQYPLGSIFKIITMAAGMETGLTHANATFNCGHSLFVCDRVTLYDWTWTYGEPASGLLNLPQGLMRSCNPWFYWIGENLYTEGFESALSDMAFDFGLGAQTGVELPEESGNIPVVADSCVVSAQMAIGQGEILVTPLQVVSFFAALANGGTLYQPALVERIEPSSGAPTAVFSPEPTGELPISEATYQAMMEGLRMVVEDPTGTGLLAAQGLDVPVSGKTGTAETPTGNPHAWFAGFTRQEDPNRPDIAVVVIIENGGEGSQTAAPVFRRAVSLYFSDYSDPGGLMPWEEEPYQMKQPTPTEESTSDG